MAWRLDYSRKHSKEAASALRSGTRQRAIQDATDPETPPKKKSKPKHFGLELFYRSLFKQKFVSTRQWYETERDRDQAQAKFSAELFLGAPRFEKIERVAR